MSDELAPRPVPELVSLVEAPPADTHPVAVYLAGLSAGSRPVMLSVLGTAAALLSRGLVDDVRLFPWASLRYEHLTALRAILRERYAPATTNHILCAVRGVLREAWRLGQLSTDDYQRARDVGGVRGSRLPAGRDIAMSERQRLLEACAADPLPARGARDAAMIALLSGTGIRRAELVGLDLVDVNLETGAVRVLGKGDKERRTYLVDGARRALDWWLSLRGTEPGALFVRVLRGGHIRYRRLQPRAVAVVVERRIREVGMRAATPHDFRRTLTGDLLDAGADLATVQAILGHASPTTTARYDRRGDRTRKKALELVAVPFGEAEVAHPPEEPAPAPAANEEWPEPVSQEPELVPPEQGSPEAAPPDPVPQGPIAHAQLRVRLLGTKVWRRLRLPLSCSFDDLHRLIQDAFEWEDFHLYRFRGESGAVFFDAVIASHPQLDEPSASAVRLGDHLALRGDECVYDYDLGDAWLCAIDVQKVRDYPAPEAWVLAGGGTAPPEDCGGVLGFRDLLKQFRRRRVPRDTREWLGGWRPDGFDKKSLPRRSEWVTFDDASGES